VVYQGGQTIDYPVDSEYWQDIPLFIRDGAIIPTAPVMQYVNEKPLTSLDVDVFPSDTPTQFDYYDDDGTTYSYEQGKYFQQQLSVQKHDDAVRFTLGTPHDGYQPALQYYVIKIHGVVASRITQASGTLSRATSLDALRQENHAGWVSGNDLYGNVTYIKLAAGKPADIRLEPASSAAQHALDQHFADSAEALMHQAGAAQPTAEQLRQLKMAVHGPGVPLPIRPSWNQALPSITQVILYLSCYPSWDAWNHLHAYQVPGITGTTYYLSAMNATRYHDKHQCLTVRGIHSVAQSSADAFSFRVLFVADDSKESADRTFGMVRQPDGRWLFARGGF
jgi:hypothetical protein